MKPLDIQYELKKRNITQEAIAKEVGVTGMAVSYVIHKKMVSRHIMVAIAQKIGRDPVEVFPEYFFRKAAAKAA